MRSDVREDASDWPARKRAKPQAESLPDVAAGIPGPVGARVGTEAPFETEGEREVVLRSDAVVAEGELVSEFGPCGKKAAEWVFQTDPDWKCPQRFVATVAAVGRIVDFGCADA